jgi:hypothetical protein
MLSTFSVLFLSADCMLSLPSSLQIKYFKLSAEERLLLQQKGRARLLQQKEGHTQGYGILKLASPDNADGGGVKRSLKA